MRAARVVSVGFELHASARRLLELEGCVVDSCLNTDAVHVGAACADADVVIAGLDPMGEPIISQLERCRAIVRLGVGYDNIDLRAARAYGIPVAHVPDYGSDDVADHAMALTLALIRHLKEWTFDGSGWPPAPQRPMPALRYLRFGVLGCGRIGSRYVRRLSGFGAEIAVCDPHADVRGMGLGVEQTETAERLFEECDVISLHIPLTPSNHHFVSDDLLGRMRPDSLLINTSRGGVVDTDALLRALDCGRPVRAALDVFEEEPLSIVHPLRGRDDVLLTPHIAWQSDHSRVALHTLAAEEAVRAVLGVPLRCPVPE
jgi:D-3-phosphoglycerate dehydrogenase